MPAHTSIVLAAAILSSTLLAWTQPALLETSRHLRDVLRAKGYPVEYREFPGGHDYLSWRGSLADALITQAQRASR